MYKKALLLLSLLLVTAALFAQPPAGIGYSGVAKDPLGNPARNRTIYIKGAIVQNAAIGGKIVFEETHQVQSNADGVFNIVIGQGTKTSTSPVNSLLLIDWAHGPFFYNLKLAVAPSVPAAWWVAADNYQDFGTMQLWSSPYALYAANASVTNVTTSLPPGGKNTFLVTDSSGTVKWAEPQAANVNVTQVTNVNLNLQTNTGQFVSIPPNTTSIVKVYVKGIQKGDVVLVSAQGDYLNWAVYNSWVGANDTVSVRFANFTAKPVEIQGSEYKIVAIK